MLRLWQASLVRQFYNNRWYRKPKASSSNMNWAQYLEPSCGDDGGEDILELSRALVVARAVLAVQFQERHLEPTTNVKHCSWQVW